LRNPAIQVIDSDMRSATDIIHGSTGGNRDADPLTTPIYETTTFIFENAAEVQAFNDGKSRKFLYSRYGNPTTVAVERTIAKIEGAESAMLLASGMAATSTALLALLKSGDEVVCSAAIYGGTLHLLADLFPHYGITARFATIAELAEPDRLIGDRTKVLWFESPINPTLRCVDVAAIAAACRKRNVISIIGRVRDALRKAGQDDSAREFVQRAYRSGSYDEVLQLCLEYVEVT